MDSLDDVVDDYIERERRKASRLLEHYRRLPTDQDAVRAAALAQLPSGRRHDHQHRIPGALLEESARRLSAEITLLRAASSFDELLCLVDDLIRPIIELRATDMEIGPRHRRDGRLRHGAAHRCAIRS